MSAILSFFLTNKDAPSLMVHTWATRWFLVSFMEKKILSYNAIDIYRKTEARIVPFQND